MKRLKWLVVAGIVFSFTACHRPPDDTNLGCPGCNAAKTGTATSLSAARPGHTPAVYLKPVSFGVLQDYPKGENLGEVLKDFRVMKELGVTTWRGSFSWIDYEPERGDFDFAWLRSFVELAGRAAGYNELLGTASALVKDNAPGTRVLMGGMVYPDERWVEAACITYGNAGSFDVLPFHAYPETWTPPEITVENYLDQGRPGFFHRQLVALVEEKCAQQPLWINEMGFATSPGKTELEQANWWARVMSTFLSDPRVQHLGIYQVRDREPSAKVTGVNENYYLGLARHDRSQKLAFKTVKLLLGLLNVAELAVADAQLAVEVTRGKAGELHHHLFVRPDGRQVLFVWDKKGSPTLRLRARQATNAVEYALDGTPAPVKGFDGRSLAGVRLAPGMVRIFELE